MLTPHCSAASGMVAPPSIASTTRLRKSSEYGFAIHAGLLPVGSLNHIRAGMGIPDSAFSGNALIDSHRLAKIIAFENEEFIFPNVPRSFRFCLLVIRAAADNKLPEFSFFLRRPDQILQSE